MNHPVARPVHLPCHRPAAARGANLVGALALLCAVGPTAAWATETKNGGGDWFTDGTWTDGQPSAATNATISPGDSVRVARPNAGANIVFDNGEISVQAEPLPSLTVGSLVISTALILGYGGTGQMSLSGGGQVSAGSVTIGYNQGSTGFLKVDGAPGPLGAIARFTSGGQFIVGGAGFGLSTGLVIVQNGGRIQTATVRIGSGTSLGSVQVDAATWTNSNLFTVGDGGPRGELLLTKGATLTTLTGAIGYGSGGGGTLTDTVGSAVVDNSTWTNTGVLDVGGYAQGILRAVNGSKLSSAEGRVGSGAGSVGVATLEDTLWNVSSAMSVGLYGDGTLTIGRGATVASATGVVGRYGQAKGAVIVDGGTWTDAGELVVGHGVTGLPGTAPEGTMRVQNGGQVTSAYASIGLGPRSRGSVEVRGFATDGRASSWDAGGELVIGRDGSGTLTVTDGGRVTALETFVGRSGLGGGTLELLGSTGRRGVLETGRVLGTTDTIVFDGGVLRALADQPDFLYEVGPVQVRANGAIVDTNGRNVGIGSTLNGVGGLTKTGAGTLDFRGVASLGTQSEVAAGKLAINGLLNGDVRVDAGATLGGTGTIVGAVDVLAGGILSPGNSPGTLTIGSLNLERDARLSIELGAIGDQLVVNGDVRLDGYVDFFGDAALFGGPALPTFLTYTGTLLSRGLLLGAVPDGLDAALFAFDFDTPGVVGLRFAAASPPPVPVGVPEPPTIALLITTLIALAWLSRHDVRGPSVQNHVAAEWQYERS